MSETVTVENVDQSVSLGDGDDLIILEAISNSFPRRISAELDGGLGLDTLDARNVFAGYSYTLISDETFVDRDAGREGVFAIGDFRVSGVEIIYGNSTRSTHYLLQKMQTSVTLHGGSADDRFVATFAHSDTFFGYGGDDTFNVRPNDSAFGGTGNDTFELSATPQDVSASVVDGEDGTDLLDLSFGWTVDLRDGTANSVYAGSDDTYSVSNIENVSVYSWRSYETTVSGDDEANVFSVNPSRNDGSAGVFFDGRGGADQLLGGLGDDTLLGADGNDVLVGSGGSDLIDGGAGNDSVRMSDEASIGVRVVFSAAGEGIVFDPFGGTDSLVGIEGVIGTGFDDILEGADGADTLEGAGGDDRLEGGAGSDSLNGGDGADTITGGAGDDWISGGDSDADLRDEVFGGDGNDTIEGGAGNDELRGDAGNDDIAGGAGADTVIGGAGDDVMTGSNFGDVIFGGDGFDFINGGFGSDRLNGGNDADRFFHVGVAGHGSDWIQDYDAAEGDVLLYGGSATIDQFQVNRANTANAGEASVDEAFVIYKPTGQILWALVDGFGNDAINIRIGGVEYDLLG